MGGIENMKEINFCEAYKQRKENHIAKSSFVGFVGECQENCVSSFNKSNIY